MTPSDEEILSAFQTYLDARAEVGVVLAQCVQSITIGGGVVEVIFDPQQAGISAASFDDINPYDNLAEFAGAVIAFDDDLGLYIRPGVVEVKTTLADGSDLVR